MLQENPTLEADIPELSPDSLYRPCNPEQLGFRTTEELPDLSSIIGQPRAQRALALGSEVSGPGFNIFVMGLPASGRTTLACAQCCLFFSKSIATFKSWTIVDE